MAVAYGTVTPAGLLSQQYPPPLLPKPGKDNVRLQKLLKRTAKKKSSAQASQSATPFRSSLSPVNEASPDLERSDNSTPPKTPETPFSLHSIQPAPRFTARPLYQHVASPYPQRAAYPRPVSTSPQAVAAPSYTHMQDVTTFSSTLSESGLKPVTGGGNSQGKTPTSHTPNISRVTPTPDTKRATPTSDISRVTPTPDTKRATPTSDIKKAAPLSVINVKEPTYEFEISRITAGRPRTPARAATPAFEVSRPNPLLFAVTPTTPEPERSSTSQTVSTGSSLSLSQGVKTTESPEALLNGEIHSDVTPVAKATQENTGKPKPESDLTREMIRPAPVDALTPTSAPTSAVSSPQRPKTPTYEASRLLSTSPGYKRPKTPTYGVPRTGVSPVAFQRPKTPTQQKSSYRGLTPAEYAAYGGIKTYSPAFGIGSTTMPIQEEVKPQSDVPTKSTTPTQGPSVTGTSTMAVLKTKEPPKDVGKPQQAEEKTASIPTIVVSQASESSGTVVTKDTTSHQVAAKHETVLTQEAPKVMPQSAESKTSVKHTTPTPVEETITTAPEVKHALPQVGNQDPLKAVKKLLGKNKAQTTEQKPQTESKSDVLVQNEPVKTVAAMPTTPKDSRTSPVTAGLPVQTKPAEGTADQEKDKQADAASAATSASDKEVDKPLPAAEPLLKVLPKPKGIKTKASGWSRLKKHMVVEQEEPKFPEAEPEKEAGEQRKSEGKRQNEVAGEKAGAQDDRETSGSPKAVKMWDAVLFQMFSSKENIMHQIELNKSDTEKTEEKATEESKDIPSFAYRLPVLLFSPKFDAKKLKEAASRPVTKISTVFEMGLIGRKGKEEEPKDFNRTARGFAAS
uniref:Proline rich 33 n=1 Tax=Salarias fasciatus TaxID=181472 RepID=A0A672FXN8_SALFA